MAPIRYTDMALDHLPPLARIRANRRKIRFSNPFTFKNAAMLTLILGTVLAFTVTIDNLKYVPPTSQYWVQLLLALTHNMILSGLVFWFCFVVYGRCIRELGPTENATRYIVVSVVGSMLVAFLYSIASRWVCKAAFNVLGVVGVIGIGSINDGLLAAGALLIASLIFTLTRHQMTVLANEQLQSERLITHCEALEQQTNPHFLFNSLNTLGGLIGVDDNAAQHYLQQLAYIYRYVMQQHQHHAVTFADEMAFVDTYCDMMQIRYGQNLNIVRRIDPAVLQFQVPPISVQLLVENAIKHNVISDRHPLTITIEAEGSTLRVSNPRQPKQDEPESNASNHVGLENLNQRYKLLFQQEIQIKQTPDSFIVELPLIRT